MFGVPCPPLLVRRSECGLGFLEAGRPIVGLDPPASGAMSEDGPEPSRAWWCWRAQLIHAAHHHPVIENAVVLQVRVDRRCLEPGRAKGERHHYKPYRV